MRDHGLPEAAPLSSSLPDDPSTTAAYLQALFVHSPVAIVALDAQHRFVMCNPAFEVLFQLGHDALRRADLDDLIASPEQTGEARRLSRRVLEGEKVHTVTQRRRGDGMMLDVEIYGIPLIVDGALSGVYGVYQDVTERNRAQTAFQQLTHKLDTLQQEERRRIARDLHDSTSQELAVLNWNLTLLTRLVKKENVELHDLVADTKALALECSARIRSASYLLHPPLLGDLGLAAMMRRLATEFEGRSGIRTTADCSTTRRFEDAVEIAIFRVLQETLANVLRHSGSPVVRLSLHERAQTLCLTVSDEGRQSRPESTGTASESPGVGMAGMRERLEHLGGSLLVQRTEHGTTVIASLPFEFMEPSRLPQRRSHA